MFIAFKGVLMDQCMQMGPKSLFVCVPNIMQPNRSYSRRGLKECNVYTLEFSKVLGG